jgi:hypothetical protein
MLSRKSYDVAAAKREGSDGQEEQNRDDRYHRREDGVMQERVKGISGFYGTAGGVEDYHG